MPDHLIAISYEKMNSTLSRILPEEKRDIEKRQQLKDFGIICFKLGYSLANIEKQEEEKNN